MKDEDKTAKTKIETGNEMKLIELLRKIVSYIISKFTKCYIKTVT